MVNIFCCANTLYTSKVPVVSIFADIIGTPFHSILLCLNLIFRSNSTSDLLFNVDLFGRIKTLLKSNFTPNSIFVIV